MNVTVFTPQASFSPEAGTMFLFARYLKNLGFIPSVLNNNGMFSILETDVDKTWRQSVVPWMACIGEQRRLANWAGTESEDLSKYLFPIEVRETRRWIEKQKTERLLQLEVKGIKLFELAKDSFAARFGIILPDLRNKNHEIMVRRLLLSVSRMLIASRRYLNHNSPGFSLVAGGEDFISKTFIAEAERQNSKYALFTWQSSSRAIRVKHPDRDESILCEFVVEDVATLRPEANTWPSQVHEEMQGLADFFDISQNQLQLPIAR
ncbi:MAG: hypothetical protein R3A13_04655 [Bdellovibrionota bacterium]